jgi:hypothetical protein
MAEWLTRSPDTGIGQSGLQTGNGTGTRSGTCHHQLADMRGETSAVLGSVGGCFVCFANIMVRMGRTTVELQASSHHREGRTQGEITKAP